MCGIVGYAGYRQAQDVVLEGLSRLEYRGYDSAGMAVLDNGKLAWSKRAGKLGNLKAALAERPPLTGTVGLGHTRWATHGPPTDPNAHPHTDCGGRLAVVHNGIIENFAVLRAELEAGGHELTSQTDTELVAHLLEEEMSSGPGANGNGAPRSGPRVNGAPVNGAPVNGAPVNSARANGARANGAPQPGSLATAMRAVCQRLEGAFTLVAVDIRDPEAVVGARRNSPLVVGRGDGENFLASDVAAFIAFTRDAVELGQDQVAELRPDRVTVTGFDGTAAPVNDYHVDWDVSAAEKTGFEYFMLKEIAEQPHAITDALLGRVDADGLLTLDEMRLSDDELRNVDKIIIVACGTAYHAGLIAKYAIEHWCEIPCEVELASEFRYRDPILTRSTLVIAISQSGETMDTLMAVRHAREQRSRVVAICNVNGSSISRESDAVVYTHAGWEIAVASTKAFLTQLVACYLLALYLAQVRGVKFGDEISGLMKQLQQMPAAVQQVLRSMDPVRAVARDPAGQHCVLFLGAGTSGTRWRSRA